MAIQDNPYLPPASRVADGALAADGYIDGGHRVDAGHAWDWIASGWRVFRRQMGIWMAIVVVFGMIMIGLSVIPFLGQLAVTLLSPVFVGGLMLGCRKAESGEDLELADLFSGFQQNAGNLILVGLIGLALMIAVMIPAIMVAGISGFAAAFVGGTPEAAGAGTLLAILVFMALVIPVQMALWFAPALVALLGQGPVQAIGQSFRACIKNIMPFLVYGLILLMLAIVATIPLMLGWLALGPVIVASVYAAYRDIFFER